MKLEDGKVYRCRDGSRVALIVGDAKRPNTKYSRAGDWYDANTGQFLHYGPDAHTSPRTYSHKTAPNNWRDLVALETEQ